MKTTLETRMLNVLKKNPIENPTGKYKAAINRLIKKGMARATTNGYELSVKQYLGVTK